MRNRPKSLRMHARDIISKHPQVRGRINDALIRCIEACYDCEQACTACADGCLGEDTVRELTQCVRLNLDCADICAATGSVASRNTGHDEIVLKSILDVCMQACEVCREECLRHAAMHEHCKVCAEVCEQCLAACKEASAHL